MFCTYSSLIAKNKGGGSRLKQLIAWAADGAVDADGVDETFDGCLVFDEAHKAKSTGTKTGDAVKEIQRRLPNARVMYVSATAAAEVKDLGYMDRLGLWGEGAPFVNAEDFADHINKVGVGAMELLAMDMKARGMYVARQLSFKDCVFEKRECALSTEQRKMYDDTSAFWEEMLRAFEQCA
eukprot:7377044-Prymnesium_polylepis.1